MATFSKIDVTTVATKILAINGNRKSALVVNRGTADIYLGADNTVTSTTGVLFRPQEQLTFTGDADEVWAIASSGTQPVHIVEVA